MYYDVFKDIWRRKRQNMWKNLYIFISLMGISEMGSIGIYSNMRQSRLSFLNKPQSRILLAHGYLKCILARWTCN